MTFCRFARYFPNTHILFCSIILEFGRKGDLVSALNTFEASKQDMDCPNMYIYRTIIDVCGICGDFLTSRSIYEVVANKASHILLFIFHMHSILVDNTCVCTVRISHMPVAYVYLNCGVSLLEFGVHYRLKSCCS